MVSQIVRDDVGVVLIDLDIAPKRDTCWRRQLSSIDGVRWIRDLHKSGSICQTNKRNFSAIAVLVRMGPSPNVIGVHTEGKERQEIDIAARILTRHAVFTQDFCILVRTIVASRNSLASVRCVKLVIL